MSGCKQSGIIWTDFMKCPVSGIMNTRLSLSFFNAKRWTDGQTCRSCRLIFANYHRERADKRCGTGHCVINNRIWSWKFAALCGYCWLHGFFFFWWVCVHKVPVRVGDSAAVSDGFLRNMVMNVSWAELYLVITVSR